MDEVAKWADSLYACWLVGESQKVRPKNESCSRRATAGFSDPVRCSGEVDLYHKASQLTMWFEYFSQC